MSSRRRSSGVGRGQVDEASSNGTSGAGAQIRGGRDYVAAEAFAIGTSERVRSTS